MNNLKDIITMDDEACFMAHRWQHLPLDYCRRQIVRQMGNMYITAKAKKFEFKVQGMRCVKEDGTSLCRGACTMLIMELLQDMALPL